MFVLALVIFYALICLMMMGYCVAFTIRELQRDRALTRDAQRLAAEFQQRLSADRECPMAPDDVKALAAQLRSLTGLEAFNLAAERVEAADPHALERSLARIAPSFAEAASRLKERDDLTRSLFCWTCARWYRQDPVAPAVYQALEIGLRSKALYTRQNALAAIASLCGPRDVAHALRTLSAFGLRHSPRLITETILAHTDGHAADDLADALLAVFDDVTDEVRVAIVNITRLSGAGQYSAQGDDRFERMHTLMIDEQADKELRLACIRYFMRNHWDHALPTLIAFAQNTDPTSWEFSAVSALALGSYPGAQTVETLRRCLSSRTWYVRHNAADSLFALGCTLDDLTDILEGPDRFAADMVRFRWQSTQRQTPAQEGE